MVDVVARTAEQVFIPLTVGGGIRGVEDARRLLRAGADKVSVNTSAVQRPELIAELPSSSARSASSCAIDARRRAVAGRPGLVGGPHPRRPHADRASTSSPGSSEAERRGAGEILLTSMDRDGTQDGYDLELTRAVADAVGVPVIASGGVGTLEHLVEGVVEGQRRRRAGGLDLPLRRAHDRRGEGADGRGRHRSASGLSPARRYRRRRGVVGRQAPHQDAERPPPGADPPGRRASGARRAGSSSRRRRRWPSGWRGPRSSASGPNVRSVEVGDQVLFSPDDRYEVEVGGEDYLILRERDIHAVAAERLERARPASTCDERPPVDRRDRRAAGRRALRRRRAGARPSCRRRRPARC